jgi:hypothetical protein
LNGAEVAFAIAKRHPNGVHEIGHHGIGAAITVQVCQPPADGIV